MVGVFIFLILDFKKRNELSTHKSRRNDSLQTAIPAGTLTLWLLAAALSAVACLLCHFNPGRPGPGGMGVG